MPLQILEAGFRVPGAHGAYLRVAPGVDSIGRFSGLNLMLLQILEAGREFSQLALPDCQRGRPTLGAWADDEAGHARREAWRVCDDDVFSSEGLYILRPSGFLGRPSDSPGE